jgi:hypothetical protein
MPVHVYVVTFLGRLWAPDIPPITFVASEADDLVDRIRTLVAGLLHSRDPVVHVDRTMAYGSVMVGGWMVLEFTIARKPYSPFPEAIA